MDPDAFGRLVRALSTTPTRRAVNRALVGVMAGSFLAPLMREAEAGGKGKRGSRRHKKRKKGKLNKQCYKGSAWCEAGDLSECCSTAINQAEGEPYEICTSGCGCCDLGYSTCCAGRGEALCCANSETCQYGPDFKPTCCRSDWKWCGSMCCPRTHTCCADGHCEFYPLYCD